VKAAAPKLFISYRREETAGHAGRLYDAIAGRFGDSNVFMDVNLAPGIDFVEQIANAVGACDVLLVVMGPRWTMPSDEKGGQRLEDPNDFVRLEVEIALSRPNVSVIPLLVAGARMPEPDELPESIRALSRRNALELSDLRWRYDVGRLVSTLAELLEGPSVAVEIAAPTPDHPRPAAPPPSGRKALVSAIVAALTLGAAAAVLALGGVFSGETDTARRGVTGNDGGPHGATTEDAVRLVGRYERIYEAKDLDGLRTLLDPGVVLKKGEKQEIHGINKVLDRYRDEFRRFGKHKPAFDWEDDHTDAGERDLEVAGPYVISADDRRETGRFGFLLQSISTSLLITEICFGCPDLRRGGSLTGTGPTRG
jgi:hypothetical protein